MKLILHGGLGKTATTWLQTVGLPALNVRQLGKHALGYPEKLEALQYELFSPVYKPTDVWTRNRNSTPLVREFADGLTQVLLKAHESRTMDRGSDTWVFSDENMLTYGGVEINIPLLSALIHEIDVRMNDSNPIEVDIVITIREQKSFLRSYYAYDYANLKPRFRTFGKFLEHGMRNPNGEVFGMLHYNDLYVMLNSNLGHRMRVRLVPYEELRFRGSSSFLGKFLDEANWQGRSELAALDGIGVNTQGGGDYHLRDSYRRSLLLSRLLGRGDAGLRNRASRMADSVLTTSIGKRIIPPEPTRIRKSAATYETWQEESVDAIFACPNRHASELTDIDLESLGYAVGTRQRSEEPNWGA